MARSSERLEICDVVLRLLAASVVSSGTSMDVAGGVLINAASLAYLMEHCQSLKALTLADLRDENHRALGAYSRPDLEIELTNCPIVDGMECFGRGPWTVRGPDQDSLL
jgi:hypothetical protein